MFRATFLEIDIVVLGNYLGLYLPETDWTEAVCSLEYLFVHAGGREVGRDNAFHVSLVRPTLHFWIMICPMCVNIAVPSHSQKDKWKSLLIVVPLS